MEQQSAFQVKPVNPGSLQTRRQTIGSSISVLQLAAFNINKKRLRGQGLSAGRTRF